ncbi:MAG: hypothetical protein ACFBRM_09105 [Pikeienuella sp.]
MSEGGADGPLAKLRPLLPYLEPGATGAAALWLIWSGLEGLLGGRIDAALALVGGGLLGAWALAAWRRTRLAAKAGMQAAGGGPGLVRIEEGRIGYYGPETGGFAGLDAISAVAVETGSGGAITAWVLRDGSGNRLTIPAGALGADALPDQLTALPGFDAAAVVRAVPSVPGVHIVWRRPGTEPRSLPR